VLACILQPVSILDRELYPNERYRYLRFQNAGVPDFFNAVVCLLIAHTSSIHYFAVISYDMGILTILRIMWYDCIYERNCLTLNMLTKEQVIGAFNKLPHEFSVEQAIDEIILLEKIENGLIQSRDNNVIPDEQLDKELPEWLR